MTGHRPAMVNAPDARRAGLTVVACGALAVGIMLLVAARLQRPVAPAPVAVAAAPIAKAPPLPAAPAPPAQPQAEPAPPAPAPVKRDAWVWPHTLPAGAMVGVVAPGRPVDPQRFAKGVAALQKRGYKLKLGAHVRSDSGGYAGTAAQRAADLNAMWADSQVQAIWCARGGKGCIELLDRLDWDVAARRRLPLIGYSDVTILHLAQLRRSGLIGISAAMVASEYGYGADSGINAFTHQDLTRWLRRGPDAGKVQWPAGTSGLEVVAGRATGPLLGGNLSRLVELLGSSYLPPLDGAILLLEDVHETPASVQSMLGKLGSAGVFRMVGGVVLADFHDACDLPTLHAAVKAQLGDRRIPVLSKVAYGHILERSTLPIGATVTLTTNPPALRLAEPGAADD